jgi:hypothetical protein
VLIRRSLSTGELAYYRCLHDRLEEMPESGGSDVSVQLSFDDRPLKLGAARIDEIFEAIASHRMSQPAESMRFDDAGLSVQLTCGAVTTVSRVAVTFAGGFGLNLTAHMADVEREIANKATEKATQAGTMPTMVLLDMSRTGWAWMRGPQAMIPALQRILPSTPFAGLGVFFTSLDRAEPMQTHLSLANSVQPDTAPLIEQVATAVKLTAHES